MRKILAMLLTLCCALTSVPSHFCVTHFIKAYASGRTVSTGSSVTNATEDAVATPAHAAVYKVIERENATCIKTGYILYENEDDPSDRKYEYLSIDSSNHVNTQEEEVESTCKTEGYKRIVCSDCGTVVSVEKYPLKAHSYIGKTVSPDCENEGYTVHTCTVCGVSYTDKITPATGHKYILDKKTEPSCTKEGKNIYVCSVCGNKKEDIISKTEHTYSYSHSITATCTKSGCDIYICDKCGTEEKQNIVPAAGHKWIYEINPASSEEAGYTRIVCSVCGEVRSETALPQVSETPEPTDTPEVQEQTPSPSPADENSSLQPSATPRPTAPVATAAPKKNHMSDKKYKPSKVGKISLEASGDNYILSFVKKTTGLYYDIQLSKNAKFKKKKINKRNITVNYIIFSKKKLKGMKKCFVRVRAKTEYKKGKWKKKRFKI